MKRRFKKYNAPPKLSGYTYTSSEARLAGRENRLLAMRLETSNACNLNCVYCNNASGKRKSGEIGFAVMKKTIDQAQDLGARSVIVIGGGEPTVYPRFRSLITYIHDRGLIPVVITNGLLLDRAMVSFLYQENASILLKLDSFEEKTQDRLAGRKYTYRGIMLALENLFSAGFHLAKNKELRLGGSFVLTRLNYQEIIKIWRFCRDHGMYPNLEELIPRGRGFRSLSSLIVEQNNIRKLKRELLMIDRSEYGYDWLVYAPLPGYGCLQHLYSIYLACDGYVRPCADVDIKMFHIEKMKLRDIVGSDFFNYLRQMPKHIRGKCHDCKHRFMCAGCRGNAYTVGIRAGEDMYQAVSREDPVCWK